jgi:hypothetical protein
MLPATRLKKARGTTLVRQRMVKSANSSLATPTTGFASDATYLATVNGGSGLVVAGAGVVTVVAVVKISSTANGTITAGLAVNGTLVAGTSTAVPVGTTMITTALTVAPGDVITLVNTTTGAGFGTVAAGTYVEVVPLGNPAFEAFGGDGNVNTVPSVSVTTSAGALLLIVSEVGASPSNVAVTVDGDAAIPLTSKGNNTALWVYAGPNGDGCSAGSHTVTMSGGNAVRTLAVGSYAGAKAVVGAAFQNSFMSANPAITPAAGSGPLCVGGFYGAGVDTTTTATGTIRGQVPQRVVSGTNTRPLALADGPTAPVGLTLASATAWEAVGAWLT